MKNFIKVHQNGEEARFNINYIVCYKDNLIIMTDGSRIKADENAEEIDKLIEDAQK